MSELRSQQVTTGNARTADAPVDQQFLDRWSPRAFSHEPLDEDTIHSLFEAARWVPSAGNEQPWVYLYATTPYESLKVPRDRYEIMAAIAIGRYGDPSQLDEFNQGREKPSNRKRVSEFTFHSRFLGPLP